MAQKLKHTVDDLSAVPEPLRGYYASGEDGQFMLAVEGHPDSARLAEFRVNNVALLKERDALKSQADSYSRAGKRAEQLEAELAAERAAHASTQFRHSISVEFLRAGGRESAVDFMVGEAAKTFTVSDGKVTTKEFSVTNPGESLTVGEWLEQQSRTADFAFKPSKGGGAPPTSGGLRIGPQSGAKELRNPTAQELGEHAAAIASGTLKVVYTS